MIETPGGTLFLVATPIGNLGDLSSRAREVLSSVDLILCEDTRVTRKLFTDQPISCPFESYHEHCEQAKTPRLVARIKAGESMALVSDAGTPAISDPGFRLVHACRKEGVSIVPIPGPAAFLAALCASGLPTNGFLFLGFPPFRTGPRKKLLQQFANFPYTVIFYESCHRIHRFLEEAAQILGSERLICVAKELTKIHESFFFGTISEVKVKISIPARGEFVVLIAPSDFHSAIKKS